MATPNALSATKLTAEFIATELRANPALVLGLATGCTMEAVYDHLVRLYAEQGLDFSQCKTFNLDEYVGLGADDPYSLSFLHEGAPFWESKYQCAQHPRPGRDWRTI